MTLASQQDSFSRDAARALDEAVTPRATHDRAAAVVVGGASTGSKRSEALYGRPDPAGPTHYREARGCTVVSADGTAYTDCTMALGAVSLGYADEGVTRSVVDAIRAGNVACWSPALEVEVAERLCEAVPCAERVRFLKSGAEGVAAAVRIARAATGRSRVIGCGYFGWLDWSSIAAGVPAGVRADYTTIPFDDVAALEMAGASVGRELAAVIIEPVIERYPAEAWVRAARRLCDEQGAVLIFDEIKTGFRIRTGGYQEVTGITPDIAIFGKALANGFPLAAVVGRSEVMEAAATTWISSTLASETSALAAAAAVLDRHDRADVCASLAEAGARMLLAVRDALRDSGFRGASVEGIDPMWLIRFIDPAAEARFIELALGERVIFKRGAYNFASVAHEERSIGAIGRAARRAFDSLARERA